LVKRPVPGVEADLRRGGCRDYKDGADSEERKTVLSWRKPKGDEEFAKLMNEVAYPFFNQLEVR
jgi:hypothetical protein